MFRGLGYLAVLVVGLFIVYLRYRNRDAHSGDAADANEWGCLRCGEPVPNTFRKCWNCGTRRPDDVATIADSNGSNGLD